MKVAGLFSGIGGLELPFRDHQATTELLCDSWESALSVLRIHFPRVPLHHDVRDLDVLPKGLDVLTAGFPCTDLSQAGRTAGITGNESSLVGHVFRLLRKRDLEWLVLENVRNMLVLGKGMAMAYLTQELERLGFRWAYRLVDSQCTGVPQRRHRVLFVASRHHDPRRVLFADEAGEPDDSYFRSDAYGFYWTEGLRGLGWAKDAVPPLKGGSGLGIPSAPAIWVPSAAPGRRLVTPSIEDAEALQGFERGWTESAQRDKRNGPRWKLVGNAVTVGVAKWLVNRLCSPGEVCLESRLMLCVRRWPNAAYGESGRIWEFDASCWPVRAEYQHLTDLLSVSELEPLSHRATAGFLGRAMRSQLRFDPAFLADVKQHVELTQTSTLSDSLCKAIGV